jgi:hypothetical protein
MRKGTAATATVPFVLKPDAKIYCVLLTLELGTSTMSTPP